MVHAPRVRGGEEEPERAHLVRVQKVAHHEHSLDGSRLRLPHGARNLLDVHAAPDAEQPGESTLKWAAHVRVRGPLLLPISGPLVVAEFLPVVAHLEQGLVEQAAHAVQLHIILEPIVEVYIDRATARAAEDLA